MATFPSITPSYQAVKQSAPRTRSVQFGDGYSQRLKWGLNTDAKQWNLQWINISETDSDTIETFLEARASDSASFDWTPLDSSTAYKWVCSGWSKVIPYKNRASISATFQQVFEP